MKFVKVLCTIAAAALAAQSASAADAPWKARNDRAAEINHVKLVERPDARDNGVTPSMAPGGVIRAADIPETILAPGVIGRIYWGKGAMVNRMTIDRKSVV